MSPFGGVINLHSQDMRARGFCVGWLDSLIRAPHMPQTLCFHDNADVAGATTPVEGPTFRGDIPVGFGEGFDLSADATGLPPLPIADFTASVQPFVVGSADEAEVFKSVVLLVPVFVVEVEPRRDRAVCLFPDPGMVEPHSPVDRPSEIPFGGDIEAACSRLSVLTHASILTVLQSQVKSAPRSEEEALLV